MEQLNKYINESLLDDEDKLIDSINLKSIINEFLQKNNIYCDKLVFKLEHDNYILNAETVIYDNKKKLIHLTNGLFEWGKVGNFMCFGCDTLESLEGAPQECRIFDCSFCKRIKSLKYSPKKCMNFDCSNCINLINLNESPESVIKFSCAGCKKLKSLEGAPKECDEFICRSCRKLKSLKGAPMGCDEFYAEGLDFKITDEDKIKYNIR